jgi:hypothetical protein
MTFESDVNARNVTLSGLHGQGNFFGVQCVQQHGSDSHEGKSRLYVPTASGFEAAQHFIDRVTARHCVSS